jgi:hypothetical protein
MANERKVTERDFRLPEYQDANPEEYEWRADGKLVRKDRWERGWHNLIDVLGERQGMSHRNFEIPIIVAAVERLADKDGARRKRRYVAVEKFSQ